MERLQIMRLSTRFELLATPGCECCGRGTFPAGSYGRNYRLEWLLELYYSNIGLYLVGKCNYSWDDVAEYTDNWDWHNYWHRYYLQNPVRFIEEYLGIQLTSFQKMLLTIVFWKRGKKR